MSQIDIDKIERVHFIGVGGIGMSALARHFLREKKTVSGSDRALTSLTKTLDAEGVQIFGEQVKENVAKDIELVIYTEAVTEDSEGYTELKEARELGIPTVNYFEALGLAMNPYYLIAISGTHGKTTTTAMLTDVFEAAEKDPTAVIGSLRAKTKSNYRAGKSKYALVEACEYKKDFLHLKPDILVITNIEYDHVDFYKSLAEVQETFKQFISQINEGGVLVTDTSHPNIAPILNEIEVEVIDFKEFLDMELPLKQPGMHNRLNAAAALAVAKQQKLDMDTAREALSQFAGTWRRFEFKGEINGAIVHDEYAHHPTEISASVQGARELYPDKKILVVFQPHTYSRTAALFEGFAKALGQADEVILLPIYAAREQNTTGVTSRELSVKALEYNKNIRYIDSLEQAEEDIKKHVNQDYVVIVMGAGTVTQLANTLTK